jgi:uncharacterized Zn-binding protein involved in type VI secretion
VPGKPAAKQGDSVVAIDTHILMVPSPAGPIPMPTLMPFSGALSSELSSSVVIENKSAATKGSVAMNNPPHVPAGGSFQKSPSNQAKVQMGSKTVFINNKQAARTGDASRVASVASMNRMTSTSSGMVSSLARLRSSACRGLTMGFAVSPVRSMDDGGKSSSWG